MQKTDLTALRAELAAAKALAEANLTECEKLRDSMWEYRADNARLLAALKEVRTHYPIDYTVRITETIDAALAATPAQSLAAHDAALLREVADEIDSPYTHDGAAAIRRKAYRIEKEAANG